MGYLLFGIINADGFVKRDWEKMSSQTVQNAVQSFKQLDWPQFFSTFCKTINSQEKEVYK